MEQIFLVGEERERERGGGGRGWIGSGPHNVILLIKKNQLDLHYFIWRITGQWLLLKPVLHSRILSREEILVITTLYEN